MKEEFVNQLKLYALAAVPIITVTASVYIFYDIMLIMIVDFIVVIILSLISKRVIPTSENYENMRSTDRVDAFQLDIKKKKFSFNWIAVICILVISIVMYVLLWIVGISFADKYFTLMPQAGNTGRWFYWIIFFFIFPTAYVAIESTFYYQNILKNLQGNIIQGLIVGLLAALKATFVIVVSFDYDIAPIVWLIAIWIIMNLIIGVGAYAKGLMEGSVSRQLSYILILVGWILIYNDPWSLNKRPSVVWRYHPKNIFG